MIKLQTELGKYTIQGGEECNSAKFSFETRVEEAYRQCASQMADLGINLAQFIEPKEAEASKIAYGNIPLLTETYGVRLRGDGGHHNIGLGRLRIVKAEVAVKRLDGSTVAILKLTIDNVICDYLLSDWLFQNTGKVITVELDPVQQKLFGEAGKSAKIAKTNEGR